MPLLLQVMETLADGLGERLEPIASWFRTLDTPAPIVQWGHPTMMAIVAFVMGSYVAWAGWNIRVATDKQIVIKSRAEHRKLAPVMTAFLFMGYTGGILSLLIQKHAILASPHFWTGTIILGLLTLNGLISASKFGGGKASLRTVHAYVGTGAMALLLIHAILGLKLGVSL
jgi:hypothetical protein